MKENRGRTRTEREEEEKVVEGGEERAGGGERLFGVFESSRSHWELDPIQDERETWRTSV